MPRKRKLKMNMDQLGPPKITLRTKNLTEKQKDLIRLSMDNDNKIIFISGPAGSTKTYIAVYAALKQLKNNDNLDLLYVRTVIESADKGLGALPGDIGEKFNPYIAPLEDKLRELLPTTTGVVADLIKKQRVQAIPVNFLRGANWTSKIVIADEAQNFTFKELTTLITRLGEDSQLFICGDYMQSDINGKSGFSDMFKLFDDQESREKGIQCFSFGLKDIKRSRLLSYIIRKLSE
jgi:phosphate starvation-inducible PhoH-like protein|tara:strand:- start:163 stop:867 length:705 start_codon:yes stop_codon:yes gene_type:complete